MKAIVGLSLIAALPAQAQDEVAAEDAEVRPASDCAALFGDTEDRATNETYRQRTLDFVDGPESNEDDLTPRIYVGHHGDYEAPTAIAPRDLRLVAAEPGQALISIESDRFDCPTGLYRLHRDHDFGVDGQVLAILEDLVLLKYADQLTYLTTDPSLSPTWSMVWVSNWAISSAPTSKGGGTRARKKPTPKRAGRKR